MFISGSRDRHSDRVHLTRVTSSNLIQAAIWRNEKHALTNLPAKASTSKNLGVSPQYFKLTSGWFCIVGLRVNDEIAFINHRYTRMNTELSQEKICVYLWFKDSPSDRVRLIRVMGFPRRSPLALFQFQNLPGGA